jgi:proline dehydrogenase
VFRDALIELSKSEKMRQFVYEFGPARRAARRFVAGETLDEAVGVVKDLNARGIKAILNHVGERVTTPEEATQATKTFLEVLDRIRAEGLESTISVKPSHLGLGFGPDFFYENVADIIHQGQQLGILVEIDMEGSDDVEATLTVYQRLLDTFDGGVRLAIQSYLHRTPGDLKSLVERGANVRLVKGAYREPSRIAYQNKRKIIQAAKDLMAEFFTPEAREKGAYLALGSHDPELIGWLIEKTEERGITKDQFEFQMLQGVRRKEQQHLADLGYQVRIYVPYGHAWYPYFMRRLAERPANLFFIIRAFFGS